MKRAGRARERQWASERERKRESPNAKKNLDDLSPSVLSRARKGLKGEQRNERKSSSSLTWTPITRPWFSWVGPGSFTPRIVKSTTDSAGSSIRPVWTSIFTANLWPLDRDEPQKTGNRYADSGEDAFGREREWIRAERAATWTTERDERTE